MARLKGVNVMQSNLAYQEEYREELLNGEIVLMSPSPTLNHNRIVRNLTQIFSNFLEGKPCEIFVDGADVYLSEKDKVVPDLVIVCRPEILQDDGIHGAPDLIVEILSPSTAKRDKGYKKDLYEKSGVREYWIVDPLNKAIEVYLLKNGKFIFDNLYSLYPDYDLKRMAPEEIAQIPTEFKCSLYDELIIPIEKVFSRTF